VFMPAKPNCGEPGCSRGHNLEGGIRMDVFTAILRLFGAVISLGAFGLALFGAILSGVDPLWAILRAAAACAAILVAYSILCRLVVPLATALSGTPDAPHPQD
jgi:hypothetical protein